MAATPFPAVRIATGSAFELIAELAAFTSGPARASLDSGKTWIRETRRLAGADLIGRVGRFNLSAYADLATIALEARPPRNVNDLCAQLDGITPDALRLRMLGADSPLTRTMVSDTAIERAVAGDRKAKAEVRSTLASDAHGRQVIARLLGIDASVLKAELQSIIADWAVRVHSRFEAASLAAIERDRVAKQELLDRSAGENVVTVATNGVVFDPPPWITEVVIVPTVALRPFVVPTHLGGTAFFLCSVADDALDVDPDAPPRQLVRMAAALGDELRLRVLRALRDESLTASEIATRLGVERTSLHHHLGVLRSAGFLSVRDQGARGWRYALREPGVTGVGNTLESYLSVTPIRNSHQPPPAKASTSTATK